MAERKQYFKPRAINLSGFGVVGYEPLGTCADGSFPTGGNCAGGPEVGGAEPMCDPVGNSPELGACTPSGGTVSSACTSGTTILF